MKQLFPSFSYETTRSSSFRIQNPSVQALQSLLNSFDTKCAMKSHLLLHFILSRKKNPTAKQERLNSAKATFQLSSKPVSKLSIYLETTTERVFHTGYESKICKHDSKQGELPVHYIKLFKLGIKK